MTVPTSPSDLQITPRDLRIDREAQTPRWWMGGDPVGTAVMNALSLTFPDGERFFIQAVRRYEKDCPEQLRAQVRAFVAQEGAHTREHIAFNDLTRRSGYDVTEAEAFVEDRMSIARARPHIAQLAGTVALEHFTAVFAHALLARTELLADAPPELAKLWRWHSIEEIEHKAVAYDVLMHALRDLTPAKRWAFRRRAMFMTTLLFTRTVRRTARMLLKQDGITGLNARWKLFQWLWLKPGLYRLIARDYLAFYRPGFHPWQEDDRELIADAEAGLALPLAA
ncbi:MAG TPA: metal-dependent hydrolase [Brevundimonas sp.]